ncbi:hypothetical protein [Chondromyces apiculatus]|uniref:Uncharacterized protein n=1 Tax=Chondromyces apiculatus DSM 436 TaxID=1192034 RepID=A0A017T0F7_9BACT|nr:hypothetical protein [Chondromyces apiculatus]EYF02345.1 Hypothetical protein CAP_7274 [Chondromyces apiculatus DSM 436]
MARPSRPPGFDMTYQPERRISFGPPIKERFPSLAYLGFAAIFTGVILYGQHAANSSSWLFRYVVEGDRHRLIPSSVCAIILCTSAIAAVLREQMRGVIVHPDGVELRELFGFSFPRVRRLSWSQIDRVAVPSSDVRQAAPGEGKRRGIRLDLWDGSCAWLPEVGNVMGLAVVLERVALARAIPLEGSTGLLDELSNPLEEG